MTENLKRLGNLFLKEKIPLHYSVIPGRLEKETAEWLRHARESNPGLVEIGQHGYMHEDFGPPYYKQEFGPIRDYDKQRSDVISGRTIMKDAFGDGFSLIFSPPYHVFDRNTVKALESTGFVALSSSTNIFHPSTRTISYVPISIDFSQIDYVNGEWCTRNPDELMREFMVCASMFPFIGISLHHEAMEDSDFDKLLALIGMIRGAGNVKFVDISTICGENEKS
ncbi:MAG: hypothetical protein DRO99_03320 [Candidatus Aenigmatarchaeota archaeon]|nr:MAG: hypothetical protein DRO99_03320 [Candidatus Aenigmarchaeota archaeon]